MITIFRGEAYWYEFPGDPDYFCDGCSEHIYSVKMYVCWLQLVPRKLEDLRLVDLNQRVCSSCYDALGRPNPAGSPDTVDDV